MKITIEEKSGFCYGVVRVVEMADRILDSGEELYSLGHIVHNEMEVERLQRKGLKTISHHEMQMMHDCKILIRAHGEPPSTYETAQKNRLELIDGTCPIVRKIQLSVAARAVQKDSLVVIFGKKDHPEVEGLFGQSPANSVIVNNPDEVNGLPVSPVIHLFSQTTMDQDGFMEIISRFQKKQDDEGGELFVHNTICRHVSHRRPGLSKFASENDVVIFVGGKHSSNGKVLFKACKESNPKSYYVGSPEELNGSWFADAERIGVAGATSTPRWQIDRVIEEINKLGK